MPSDSAAAQASAASPAKQENSGAALPELRVNAQRAMQYTKEIVAFGSRPVGSEAHKKLEGYIHNHLKGAQVEDDIFRDKTPAGTFTMNNIIAKFPGSRPGIVVLGSHYDTNYPLPKTYVGANDGGSSTGLLLEFAHLLREQSKGKPLDGYSVWLVFFDGEEAFQQWSATDSLYGSRHLAEKWKQDGTLPQVKALLLADMIGDADLNIEHDGNSNPQLEQLLFKAATQLGYQSHFFARNTAIEDDHLPFARLGVPVADVIDLDYGYNNVFHHTPEDTLDKLSPKSLQISGDVMLETVHLLEAEGLPPVQPDQSAGD